MDTNAVPDYAAKGGHVKVPLRAAADTLPIGQRVDHAHCCIECRIDVMHPVCSPSTCVHPLLPGVVPSLNMSSLLLRMNKTSCIN